MSIILACDTKNRSSGQQNRSNITTNTFKNTKKAQLLNIALRYRKPRGNATTPAHYPEISYQHYKPIYYEALDSIVNAIKDRFDQPTFKFFTQADQLFLKAVGKQDVTGELKVMETHFKGDYDTDSLTSELQLLPTIFE